MQPNRSGEDQLFQITAPANEIFDRVTMTNPDDLLFDDRSVVQFRVDVVACSPDQFHTPSESLMIGLSPNKGGQEGVMNIDNTVGKCCNKLLAKNLHVAR